MRTYTNPLKFPEQHPEQGIGDPYVFRFNGRYYMCPSPTGIDKGIILWESEDMLNWEYLGNVAPDDALEHIYAPEIFYYNGTFYLVGSPRGEGHYLYTSDSPKGPYKQLTGNFGLVIDGSIFADDDGALYFTHAEYPSIHGHRMERDGTLHEAVELWGTSMGHWTEGPGIFKRGGKYYITMTGNHLLSRGYRIDYAVSNEGPLGPYRVPRNKTLIANTVYEYGSPGHSSNVIGPDLDSYWIFYHSFLIEQNNKRGHKRRGRFTHMDRMFFSGDELHLNGPSLTASPVPEMPEFYGWADEEATPDRFLRHDGFVLSAREMATKGTAEICFIPGNEGVVVFAYRDDRNYLSASLQNGVIQVSENRGESSRMLLERPLPKGFRQDVLHTVRIESGADSTAILIDQMTQGHLDAVDSTGRIGTKQAERTSYVGFSHHVGQSSDRLQYNYVPGWMSGLTAMQEDTGEILRCDDGEQRLLMKAGDKLSYRINVTRTGLYRLQATLQAFQPSAARCGFECGGDSVRLDRMDTLKRVSLSTGELHAGLQEWTFALEEGEVQLRGFDLFPIPAEESAEYSGLELCRNTTQIEGEICIDRMEGLQMDRPGQVLCQFGDRFHTDGFIETDMAFYGSDLQKSAGLFLRISENSTYADQVEIGHRGYYIGFNCNEVFIWRMNFDKTVLAKRRCPLSVGESHRLRAEISGNKISVWADGVLAAEAIDNDSLPYGVAAVGGFGARVIFTRVQFDLN